MKPPQTLRGIHVCVFKVKIKKFKQVLCELWNYFTIRAPKVLPVLPFIS